MYGVCTSLRIQFEFLEMKDHIGTRSQIRKAEKTVFNYSSLKNSVSELIMENRGINE